MSLKMHNPVSKTINQIASPQKSDLRQSLLKTIKTIEKRPAKLCEEAQTLRASFGIDAIDKALDPGSAKGIITNALHEIRVSNGLNAASGAGFALCLGLMMGRPPSPLSENEKRSQPPLFWICDDYTRQEYGSYYGPGLSALGISPEDLIRIHPSSLEESLWAAGEIASTKGAARFCLIEIRGHSKAFDLTATRRLMLRAQASHIPVIILRQSGGEEASAATTRWHVTPAPSRKAAPSISPLMHQFIGPPCFSITLEKCRSGNPVFNPFIVEWNSHDQCFALTNSLANNHARSATENRYSPQAGQYGAYKTTLSASA